MESLLIFTKMSSFLTTILYLVKTLDFSRDIQTKCYRTCSRKSIVTTSSYFQSDYSDNFRKHQSRILSRQFFINSTRSFEIIRRVFEDIRQRIFLRTTRKFLQVDPVLFFQLFIQLFVYKLFNEFFYGWSQGSLRHQGINPSYLLRTIPGIPHCQPEITHSVYPKKSKDLFQHFSSSFSSKISLISSKFHFEITIQ